MQDICNSTYNSEVKEKEIFIAKNNNLFGLCKIYLQDEVLL